MNITLNGKPHTLKAASTIEALIAELELSDKRGAVEVNLNIIPRSEHSHYQLQANDSVEIVHAIGGGQF